MKKTIAINQRSPASSQESRASRSKPASLPDPPPSYDPSSLVLALRPISGKWKIHILSHLLSGTKRFSQLRRLVTGIGRAMLSFELRQLRKDGLIERRQYETIPPTVEYYLTEKGRRLKPVFVALEEWQEWVDQVGCEQGKTC